MTPRSRVTIPKPISMTQMSYAEPGKRHPIEKGAVSQHQHGDGRNDAKKETSHSDKPKWHIGVGEDTLSCQVHHSKGVRLGFPGEPGRPLPSAARST